MNIENGCVVERNAYGPELGGQSGRKALGKLDVAAPAQDRHRRPHRKGRLQPRDASAFLINAHPQRQTRCQPLHVHRHFGDLLRRLDVACEENDATERELLRQRTHLRSNRRSGKTADQKLADVASYVRWHNSIIELWFRVPGSTYRVRVHSSRSLFVVRSSWFHLAQAGIT